MSLDYFTPGFIPYCLFCGKQCFRNILDSESPRFDGATLLATCPKGMAVDRACEVIAEAIYNVAQRQKPERGHDGWEGY